MLVLRLASGQYGTTPDGTSPDDSRAHDPSWLEIGFATLLPASQPSIQPRVEADPVLQLSVLFPQTGEAGTCEVSLPGGAARERLRVFCLDVLAPYDLGGLVYDPLGSLATSLSRLTGQLAMRGPPNDGLMALWATIEADLYRFAKDPGLTAAVDMAATEQVGEYHRFAQLNELYRDMVKLLVPYGIAPGRWTAWLRGQEYRPVLPNSLALRIEKCLQGRASHPEVAMESLTRLLVRHGASIMLERD